jgi:hypothetical protein
MSSIRLDMPVYGSFLSLMGGFFFFTLAMIPLVLQILLILVSEIRSPSRSKYSFSL